MKLPPEITTIAIAQAIKRVANAHGCHSLLVVMATTEALGYEQPTTVDELVDLVSGAVFGLGDKADAIARNVLQALPDACSDDVEMLALMDAIAAAVPTPAWAPSETDERDDKAGLHDLRGIAGVEHECPVCNMRTRRAGMCFTCADHAKYGEDEDARDPAWAPCPTCGGTHTVRSADLYGDNGPAMPCPDCTDGRVRR